MLFYNNEGVAAKSGVKEAMLVGSNFALHIFLLPISPFPLPHVDLSPASFNILYNYSYA